MKLSTIALNDAGLGMMPRAVSVPNYDRSKMRAGIVHIGVGNFHRAHLAWYLHRLMQQGQAMDWAIIGAGVCDADRVMRAKLLEQDCLTTLIELDPKGGRRAEIIGAMLDFLPVERGNKTLITTMAEARIKIVSLTITESGYYLDANSGGLDITHPHIIHDAENPTSPRTAFGAMVAALRLRRAQGLGAFTGLCCDNLERNGDVLRQAVVGLARLSDPELADWIEAHGAFPNSMVDCIVPATGVDEINLARKLGVEDRAPVIHENFRQWVMEDHFCAGRPDWDFVGAEFAGNVHDYETQKIRMLNGGHQILANLAEILNIRTIAEAITHPPIYQFFHKVQQQEIMPHIKPLPNMPVGDYLSLLESRFANKAIIDTARRVAYDGAARHVGFLLPSIRDGLAAGHSIEGLALVEAAWARMCQGTREDASIIEPNDPAWKTLTVRAKAARHNPQAWLEMQEIYGDLAQNKIFAHAFATWLNSIYHEGTENTLRRYFG